MPEARVFPLALRPGLSRPVENTMPACFSGAQEGAVHSPPPNELLGPDLALAPRLSSANLALGPGPHVVLDAVASSGSLGAPLPGDFGDLDNNGKCSAVPGHFPTFFDCGLRWVHRYYFWGSVFPSLPKPWADGHGGARVP